MKRLVLKDDAPKAFEEEALQLFDGDTAFANAARTYAAFILLPPVLAQRLRARGDHKASARDFGCPCPTAPDTDRPWCRRVFADCRFAGERPDNFTTARRLLRDSPSMNLMFEVFTKIAWTWRKASRAEQAEMLAFMSKSVDEQLRRTIKNRPSGRFFETPAHTDAAPRRKYQNLTDSGKARP